MTTFSYQALSENGSTITGTVEAPSADAAANRLANMGYTPVELHETEQRSVSTGMESLSERLTPISITDLILFTKQFRTMLKAGLAILNLLEVLEDQTENIKLKKIIVTMAADIRGGSTINESMSKFPRTFSSLYRNMVKSGEASGSLPEVLDRLAYILEHEQKVRTEVKSALQYPVIVFTFLIAAFFILLTFVIPKFTRMFQKADITLPLPTKICMVMYTFLMNNAISLTAALIGGVIALVLFLRTEEGQYHKDTLLLNLPVLGPLFVKAAMSRFASIFSILQASGVAVLESITILSGTLGNSAISREFERIRPRLEEGQGLAGPLRQAKYFPPMVVNMVAIGEESGDLEALLAEISKHYDYEVEYATKRLADAIAPFLTVVLAVMVGFFALAIFLPMWDMTKMVK